MDKNKTFNEKDFEYTIVMDASYTGPDVNDFRKPEEGADNAGDANAEYELLYSDYERMILRDPTVLDKDDAYPHSYQWRMADRYDPGKIEALEESPLWLKFFGGKKIRDLPPSQASKSRIVVFRKSEHCCRPG